MVKQEAFYQGKRIFVTGHTGFKGAWLCEWLCSLGCHVSGYALAPDAASPSLYRLLGLDKMMDSHIADIRDHDSLQNAMLAAKPDIVFHLAAQALVLPSYETPLDTFATNIMGTLHVLESARRVGTIKAIVNITTDKCYENNETGHRFREGDSLGGHDPYSASKAAAEVVSAAYRHSFLGKAGIAMATARAGNVIGGGDFAQHRLVPDMLRAVESGSNLHLRHPESIRPWQHVLDVLQGYLRLGHALCEEGSAYAQPFNFAPDEAAMTVDEVCDAFFKALGKTPTITKGDGSGAHEAQTLMLNADKARKVLSWKPIMTTHEAIVNTAQWYREYLAQPETIDAYSASQLLVYTRKV
jgi:CDP-glucose 4,6-dehydratase